MSDIWEDLRRDRERGARRLVAEYGNRLYAAALLLCKNAADAEELVFRTLVQAARHIAKRRGRLHRPSPTEVLSPVFGFGPYAALSISLRYAAGVL